MIFYLTIIIGVILDLATKQLALRYFQEQIDIIGNFIFLKYVENTGIAFSIQVPSMILKIVTIVLIIFIFYYYFVEKKKLKAENKNDLILQLSFGLVLAGAIGNGIERIFFSKVIDFLGVRYFSVFNLADSFISIGIVLYITFCIVNSRKENKENDKELIMKN